MKLNLICPINRLGYGYASQNITISLSKLSDLSLWAIGNIDIEDNNLKQIFVKLLNNQESFSNTSPSIRIFHEFSLAEHIGKGKHIGFPIFEVNQFSKRSKHHLQSQDQLFVCSKWAKSIIEQNDINIQTIVIPLGVNNSIFRPIITQKNNNTIFLNIAKLSLNKGHDKLVEYFNKAFCPNDNVELWLLCDNLFLSEDEKMEWVIKYKTSKMGSKIKFLPRVETQIEVAKIIQNTDCGIFPSRCEGWNLGGIEMMACGKPIITTNYSGHTEYCTKENSFLVDIDNFEPAYDGKWFHGVGTWAQLDNVVEEQFIAYMRFVHTLRQEGKLCINTKGIETALKYSWDNTAQTILGAL